MSTNAFPWDTAASAFDAINAVSAAVRAPTGTSVADSTITMTFTPDLSPAEVTTAAGVVADVVSTYHARDVRLSLAEYQAIKPKLVEIRSFRTRSLATWNALTTTQREADEIAYMNDLTDVLRAMLRD